MRVGRRSATWVEICQLDYVLFRSIGVRGLLDSGIGVRMVVMCMMNWPRGSKPRRRPRGQVGGCPLVRTASRIHDVEGVGAGRVAARPPAVRSRNHPQRCPARSGRRATSRPAAARGRGAAQRNGA